jgi:uncharacterized protein
MEKSVKTRPQLATPNAIAQVVQTIVASKKPQKIILFGSHVAGKAKWDSDVDLLVIMETDIPPHQRALEIRRLFARLPCPMDLFVYTSAEVEYWKELPSSFIAHILKQGVVVYEREPAAADAGVGQQS